jgi:hypothetical protein
MKLYRFSPIENEKQLMEAIRYVHFECFKLCHIALGKYLPVAGNLGIFCHDENEYKILTKLREELTDSSDCFNGKYFHLHKPIIIPAKNDISETAYEYLYIRKPDELRPEVGDADFVINKNEFEKIRSLKEINNVKVFDRPDLGMCGLSSPDFDVLPFLTTKTVMEALAK